MKDDTLERLEGQKLALLAQLHRLEKEIERERTDVPTQKVVLTLFVKAHSPQEAAQYVARHIDPSPWMHESHQRPPYPEGTLLWYVWDPSGL